jgi:nicotinate-nucleotide adenylyltransferase
MKRVYFGGSFDPPHRGHHHILLTLLKDSWCEQVHLVPTSRNPDKEARLLTPEVLRECIESWISCPEFQPYRAKLQVEWLEWERGEEASYTIDTLTVLQERHPKSPWALALGLDSYANVATWKRSKDLLTRVEELWVFPRPGFESPRPLDHVRVRWMLGTEWSDQSTEIRRKIREGHREEVRALLAHDLVFRALPFEKLANSR